MTRDDYDRVWAYDQEAEEGEVSGQDRTAAYPYVGEFSGVELMEAWGELDQAIQRCYIPGRLEAEKHPEEHLHDLRVKRDRMSRAITSLYVNQADRG